MNHDFSVLCADHLEKLEKRLNALKKSAIKDYVVALTVINDEKTNENRSQIMVEVGDILSDAATTISTVYAGALNKVQRSLSQHLVDVQ